MKKTEASIGQVSAMFGIPISTLRYYDRQNLIPNLEKTNGIRSFSEENIEAIRVIQCLKASRLEIRDIQTFMEMAGQGSKTFAKRKALFEKRRSVLEEKIAELQQEMNMIQFKCWYYEMAQELGSEEAVKAMIPDQLSEEVRTYYENSHGQEFMNLPGQGKPEETSVVSVLDAETVEYS